MSFKGLQPTVISRKNAIRAAKTVLELTADSKVDDAEEQSAEYIDLE